MSRLYILQVHILAIEKLSSLLGSLFLLTTVSGYAGVLDLGEEEGEEVIHILDR